MRCIVNRLKLLEVLRLLDYIVPSKTPKPILQCVKITACVDGVKIEGTNLETQGETLISAVVDKQGACVIHLRETIGVLANSDTEVIVIENSKIIDEDCVFELDYFDPKHFPTFTDDDIPVGLVVDLELFRASLVKVLPAVAKDESQYAINSVYLEVQGKDLFLVGTDGRRLSLVKIKPKESPKSDLKALIPHNVARLITKTKTKNSVVTLGMTKASTEINVNGISFTIAVVADSWKFPNFRDIMQKDTQSVSLPTKKVSKILKKLVFSNDDNGIKLTLSSGKLGGNIVLSTRKSHATIPVEYKGASITIGINPYFFADALKVIKADSFKFEFTNSKKPMVVSDDANYECVVMPVNL